MPQPLILITNDDGVYSPGIDALFRALDPVAEVWVFAPDRERSAVGHGISLHLPLRVKQQRERWFMVDGTPADCVLLAIRRLLGRRPDLVVSGINNGANLGDDVTYSGTVAGAREAMLLGVPSIAVSDVSFNPQHWDTAGAMAAKISQYVLEHGLPPETILNVNVPDVPLNQIQGISVTRMGRRIYEDEVLERIDPRGVPYYWIGGAAQDHPFDTGTDLEAVAHNRVSVTPLKRDYTHYDLLPTLDGITL